MSVFTTADLLNSVKQRAMLPDASTGSLSPDNLLVFATEEMFSSIVPTIMSVREKYYETYTDQTAVPDQAVYQIPARSIGNTLSAVQWIFGINILQLQPLDPTGITTVMSAPSPRGFYFQNGNIVIYPTPSTPNYKLRMRYFQRPNRLTQTINCGQITAFDPILNTVTVNSLPSSWTVGTKLDFIPQTIPFTPYGIDSAITNINGTTVTFSAIPTSVINGDWLSLAEYTPIPEIPNEFIPVLAQATACRALEAIGDEGHLAVAQKTLTEKMQSAIRMITPRDQLGSKRVVSNWRNW